MSSHVSHIRTQGVTTHLRTQGQDCALHRLARTFTGQVPTWKHSAVTLGSGTLTPKDQSLSRARLFGTPRIVARHAPLSTESPSQEYWSGLPFPSPGDLPDPGINPGSPALQADSLPSESLGKPFKPPSYPQIVHTLFCVKTSRSCCPGPAATPL